MVKRLTKQRPVWICLCLLALSTIASSPARGLVLESFLEQHKQIHFIPPFRDTIREIHVNEGDKVEKGQLLITLDLGVLLARREAAVIMARAHGRIDSAKTIVGMRKAQLENLEKLKSTGHVRPREIEKTKADLAIAEADLLAASEQQKIRRADLKQLDAQIDQKKIVAPISGIISRIYKEEGELIGGGPEDKLITIVKITPLQATFHIPYRITDNFQGGQKVPLSIDGFPDLVEATVTFASPVVNPQSGTIRITLELPEKFNAKSGIRCTLEVN